MSIQEAVFCLLKVLWSLIIIVSRMANQRMILNVSYSMWSREQQITDLAFLELLTLGYSKARMIISPLLNDIRSRSAEKS